MARIKSLIVYDHGDSSVGIQSGYWEISFNCGYGIEVDDDQLETFRDEMSKMYEWDGGEREIVEFDFETVKRLAGEQALDRMLDDASDTGDAMRAEKHDWANDEDFCNCAECERLGKLVDSIFQE